MLVLFPWVPTYTRNGKCANTRERREAICVQTQCYVQGFPVYELNILIRLSLRAPSRLLDFVFGPLGGVAVQPGTNLIYILTMGNLAASRTQCRCCDAEILNSEQGSATHLPLL